MPLELLKYLPKDHLNTLNNASQKRYNELHTLIAV